jgi:tRNA(Ile)-lysidine synthase TilS/MesJ
MKVDYRNGRSEISLGVECAYMPQLADVLRQARSVRAKPGSETIARAGRRRLAAAAAALVGAGVLLLAIRSGGF